MEIAPLRPNRLTYAVGDIHGRRDLLDQMIDEIEADADGARGDLVFLGDYIDRGPDSAAVLKRLYRLELGNLTVTCLMGNHERMLLSFLEDPAQGELWLRNGGLETIADFGPARRTSVNGQSPMETLRVQLQEVIGTDMLDWLRALPLSFLSGNMGCLHAMADPARAWEDQEERMLLWGRPSPNSAPRPDGIWLVHGHTIVDAAEIGPGRISVDTGAYKSGVLSAVRCDGATARILTVRSVAQ